MGRTGIRAMASNIRNGENPAYTVQDFRSVMPTFTSGIVADRIVQVYVDMARAVVLKARWHELWEEGMRLYIAHFLVLYLEGLADPEAGVAGLLNAGMARGAATSKTVGSVSVSYDVKAGTDGLAGWANFQRTNYWIAFATMARMLGKAGMYIP